MKSHLLVVMAMFVAVPLCVGQVTPGQPQHNGLTPRTGTIDVNPVQNNTETDSLGVDILADGKVIVGWEDDSTSDADIFFFGAIWALLDASGSNVLSLTTITNTPHPPAEYEVQQSMNTTYRAYFRSDGTPTPGNTAWGPKIKANRFGDGMGMGATAYYLGFEIPELFAINLDAGGGGDFPAVQLLGNEGAPASVVTYGDGDAETAGDIRIADWAYLANGNVVIVGESRQEADLVSKFGGSAPRRHATYKVVTQSGVEVKALSLASASNQDRCEIWHGVGVTANGFAIRFGVTAGSASPAGATVRMFDNDGNPTTGNINLAARTGQPNAGGGGRGDGAGFHGNTTDAYVHVAGSAAGPWVTVLNADGTVRWSRKVADDGDPNPAADRMDGAIAPDGRVIAVWDDASGGVRLPQARMFNRSGDPVGEIFWVSERDQGGIATFAGQQARVAWRGNTIAIVWESLNSPDTFNIVTAVRIFDVTPNFVATPQLSGVTPRTGTFDVNPVQNNTETDSLGVGIAANGNVIVGWEDDSTSDSDIFFFGAVWTLLDSTGSNLTSVVTITNTPHQPAEYMTQQSMNTAYRAYFRANGTPTPGNTAWGPKIKANPFGNGMGMGATAYYLGFEVPELFDINLDAGGGGDFPAVQLLDNDGLPAGIVTIADADAEPAGDIRIADWEHLANGNIVIVGESRQAADRALTGQTSGNVPVFRIVTPAGVQVKGYTAVSSEPAAGSIWHGVGVTAGGFAVRFDSGGATVRMFDNAGNPTTPNLKLATITGHPEAAGGGRGDGAGFHGNGRNAYVNVNNSAVGPWVTVLNTDGSVRWSRKVAEDHETIAADRMDGAISPDGRVIAVWDDLQAWVPAAPAFRLPQARLFKSDGTAVANRFWVSERDQPAPGGAATARGEQARIAWRDDCVAVVWESYNSPETFNAVVGTRIFNLPAALLITSITDDGSSVNITWTGGGPTYTVWRRSALNATPVAVATGITEQSYSEFRDFGQAFYHVTSP